MQVKTFAKIFIGLKFCAFKQIITSFLGKIYIGLGGLVPKQMQVGNKMVK